MQHIIEKIKRLSENIGRDVVLMELCGTHTEAVAKNGIKKILPENVRLLSGPGCPVCVTDQSDINAVIKLALEGIPIACYGDVLRVPGTLKYQIPKTKNQNYNRKTKSIGQCNCHCEESSKATKQSQVLQPNLSLDKAREMGADITEVYSTEDALKLQNNKPDLVFFGLGFETTTPMTADAIKRGLAVYSSHKLFVPAMQALVDTPSLKIDGFINPGHVSTIIGTGPYKKLEFKELSSLEKGAKLLGTKAIPQVITGFTGEDVLLGIYMLLRQISEGRAEVENEYIRSVRPEGNPKAIAVINEVFEVEDAYWRGLGKIPRSGLKVRERYAKCDAKKKYESILSVLDTKYYIQNTDSGCLCGAILRGLKEPKDCRLFCKNCTPENPVGACMVSSEGACGIEAKYREM